MIKRLLQLALPPSMSIFLDVDDMKDIGSLEVYIDQSQVILMFVSRGYFSSRNCEREIRQATKSAKHIVLVHEADLRRVLALSLVHMHASPARVHFLRAAWAYRSCPCPHIRPSHRYARAPFGKHQAQSWALPYGSQQGWSNARGGQGGMHGRLA